jgi:hypothetical protein
MDELPRKFSDAWEAGKTFVSTIAQVVAAGAQLAENLGAGGTALVALTIAAGAALGPLGALAAAAFAVGAAIGTALAEGETHLESLQRRVGMIRHEAHEAEMKQREAEVADLRSDLSATSKRLAAREAAGERVMRAELRALGVTTKAEAAALPEEEKQRITRMGAQARAAFDREGIGGGPVATAAFAEGRERIADRAELRRLSRLPRARRTKAVEKRIAELSEALGERKPGVGSGSGAPELSTVEADRKKRIDDLAREDARRAADAAILSGRGGDAVGDARRAEKETRERLRAAVARGEALPGEVDLAFGRVAGYSDVAGQPPPPVVVNNFRIEINAPTEVHGNFAGDPREIAASVASHLTDILETEVFPQVAQHVRPGYTR